MVFLLFFIQDRYIATLMPILVIWLGLGAYELGGWLCGTAESLLGSRVLRQRWRTPLAVIPTIALVLFFVVLQPRVVEQYTSTGSFRLEHKTIGLWLKDNLTRGSVIMSRYPAIAFYAEAQWEPTPNATYDQMLTYARAQSVDYFALDEAETRELRPQFAFLFAEDQTPSELELVHVDSGGGDRLAIFRFK